MNATYTNIGNERNAYVGDVKPGQQVFLFGEFRTVKSVHGPDWRRTFRYVLTMVDGQDFPVDLDKTVTVRDF